MALSEMWILARPLLGLVILMATSPIQASELPPCPGSPNCVSSQAEDESRRVAPIQGGPSGEAAQSALLAELESRPRVNITVNEPGRVEAEFSSAVFGFIDDVLFLIKEDGTIHLRSASRVGYWDMGANRRRVESRRESLGSESTD